MCLCGAADRIRTRNLPFPSADFGTWGNIPYVAVNRVKRTLRIVTILSASHLYTYLMRI
jgi:hypothetical protein